MPRCRLATHPSERTRCRAAACDDEPSSPRRRALAVGRCRRSCSPPAAAAAWYFGSTAPTRRRTRRKAGGRGATAARALPVVAVAARKGSIDVYLNALGTVTPRNMVIGASRASTAS